MARLDTCDVIVTLHDVQSNDSGWSRKSKLPPRRVIVSRLVRRGRTRLWAYGYADLAMLLGVSEGAVRQLVRRGKLDPSSLASVVAFASRVKVA